MQRTFFLFLLILSHQIVAQKATLKGQITDADDNQTLIGVSVVASDAKTGTVTDVNGNFNLEINASKHLIVVSFLGYASITLEVLMEAGETKTLNFKLKSKATELNAITISGSRFEKNINEETVSIALLKPKQIEHAAITQVDEMLKRIPGVDVVDGQPNIRGGSGWSYGAGSRVLVLVDDLPMLSPDAGDAKWDFLPIENCEQIEVIKGASSALYGSSALNGVINFRTAFARNTPQTKITINQGIYDSPLNKYTKWWGNNLQKMNGVNFFHSRKISTLDLVVGGNYYSDDSYLQGAGNSRARMNTNLRYANKHIEGLHIGCNVNAQVSKGALFFLWGADNKLFFTKPATYRSDSTQLLMPRGGVDTPSTTLSSYLSYRLNIDPYITYQTQSGYKFSWRNRYFNTINNNNKNQSSDAQSFYSEVQMQKKFFNQLNVSVGAVRNSTTVRSQLYSNHKSENFAGYMQIDEKISNRLWLSIGGRYEYNKIDSIAATTKPLGRAGLNFQVAKATYLRASYGMGYRFPTIAEKFVSTSVSIINVFPNPKLLPENGWNAEVGVKQNFAVGNFLGMIDLAGFYTRYNQMMEFTFDVFKEYNNQFGFQSRNVANTLIKGIDASLFLNTHINKVTINLTGGYTYTLPQDLAFDTLNRILRNVRYSDTLTNVLKYRYTTSAKADMEITWKQFTIGGYMRYNTYVVNIDPVFNVFFKSIADYRKKQGTADIWLFDVRLIYAINNNAQISLVVKNLLNKEYTERPAYISPPRSFNVQFVYKF